MKIGFYEADITPPLGGFVWGHYHEVRATEVADRLFARAVCFIEGDAVAAFVCVDACALPPDMRAVVTAQITEATGIVADRIFLSANHTHSGAPLFDDPSIGCTADAAYRDVCYRRTADAVIMAYHRAKERTLAYGESTLYGYAFCRDYLLEEGVARTFQPGVPHCGVLGKTDPSVPVLVALEDGRPVGAVVNYALHQCCTGTHTAYSGDYSSVLARELKRTYGEDFSLVFLLGACGDINHIDNDWRIKTPHTYEEIGCALAARVREAIELAAPVGEGIAVKQEKITLARRKPTAAEAARIAADPRLAAMRERNFRYYAETNQKAEDTLTLGMARLGNTVLYAMPGEVFCEYGLSLKERSRATHVMVATCCQDYCGYIPSRRAFEADADLYEASLCYHSCLEPAAGDKMVDQLLAMEQA